MTYDEFCRPQRQALPFDPSLGLGLSDIDFDPPRVEIAPRGSICLDYLSTPTWFLNCARSATERPMLVGSQHGSIPRTPEPFHLGNHHPELERGVLGIQRRDVAQARACAPG